MPQWSCILVPNIQGTLPFELSNDFNSSAVAEICFTKVPWSEEIGGAAAYFLKWQWSRSRAKCEKASFTWNTPIRGPPAIYAKSKKLCCRCSKMTLIPNKPERATGKSQHINVSFSCSLDTRQSNARGDDLHTNSRAISLGTAALSPLWWTALEDAYTK